MRTPSPVLMRLSPLSLALAACAAKAPSEAPQVLCASGALEEAYLAGDAIGRSVDACAGDDCTAPRGPSVASREEGSCALAGVRAGLSHRRDRHRRPPKKDEQDKKQCRADGLVVGETAAALYCDLSIVLGGLGEDELLVPGPESKCSREFEKACHAAFDRAAKEHAQRVGDPSQDCHPFIAGEFRSAYEVARFNQCLFSVGVPQDDCDDGSCMCSDQQSCDLECEGEGCDVTCERAESCAASCGDGCTGTCRDLSSCDLRAGDDSTVLCEGTDKCQIESEGGDATCRDTEHCDVDMHDGAVLCENADKCHIACKGENCDVHCRDVRECRVKLDEGNVQCERVGKCEIKCEHGRKPVRQDDGSFTCEHHHHHGHHRHDCRWKH